MHHPRLSKRLFFPIRRNVTTDDPESHGSVSQSNGDPETNNENPYTNEDHQENNDSQNDDVPPPPPPVGRPRRERKKAISDDYITFMIEDMNDLGKVEDPTSYKEAIKSENSSKWLVCHGRRVEIYGLK